MLLIIEALLLIFAALGQDHSSAAVAGQIFPLDMALNSVDDQYDGCGENMADLVKTKYLEDEMSASAEFKRAWQEGEKNARAPEDNLTKNHSIALYVYTSLNSTIYRDFNTAVRTGKQNYIDKTFKWYSLQFLLTDAIQILTKRQNKCKSTYRGTQSEFYKNVTGTEVRFGSFASSSLDRKVAQGFGTKSCFEIKTCKGADVTKYSKYPEQKEVLIPPYEKFKVTAVKTIGEQKNLWCETVYKMESSGTRSDLNCSVAFKKSGRFTENTSTFKTLRFCRCFFRKIRAVAQAVNQGHYASVRLGRYIIIGRNKMMGHQLRELSLTDEEISRQCLHVFELLVRDQLNPTDGQIHIWQQIGQKSRCHRFLHSLGFDPLILELLKPCCTT